MFGNNPYLYQPYYQAANMTRNLGGLASSGASNMTRSGLGSILGNSLGSSGSASSGLASGVGKGLLGKFSFSGFLNGASKTLNVVNQAIPIFYQVKPIFNNAKTMFRIMGAVKDTPTKANSIRNNTSINTQNNIDSINNSTTNSNTIETTNTSNDYSYQEENPVFFI